MTSTVTRWSVLFIAVVISLAPFLWMVRTAFAGREDQVDSGLRLLCLLYTSDAADE